MVRRRELPQKSWNDLSAGGKAAAVAVLGVLALIVFGMIGGLSRPTSTTPVAGSSPLPMAPTGSYVVGEQYYAGMVPMPNYVGWTLQAAVNDLGTRGITVAITNPDAASAVVIQQAPYPGTRVSPATANVIQLMVPTTAATTTTTTPPPTTTSEPPPASNTDVDVDVDVDRHHNLPDGALTGGYCRHKWWC